MYNKLDLILENQNSKIIKLGSSYVYIYRGNNDYGKYIQTETEINNKEDLFVETYYEKDFSTTKTIKNYHKKEK